MKYLDLSKPHAYLIWKGKQKAIVSPEPLPTGEKMLVIQDSKEAFGEIELTSPSKVNLTEFERLEEVHSIRPEERRLKWPGKELFYLYRFKSWNPFYDARDVEINNGEASVIPPLELTEAEQKLLEQAERLPKTLILKDEAVTLEDGQVIFCEGLDGSKVVPILEATFDEKSLGESLPLYQLALVRIPRLKLKKNMEDIMELEDEKAEGTKPYQMMMDNPDCEGHAVVNKKTGKLMGCHDNETDAMAQISDLMAAEKKGGPGSGRYPKGTQSTASPSGKTPKAAGTRRSKKELAQALVDALVEDDVIEADVIADDTVTEEGEKEQSIDKKIRDVRDSFYTSFGPKPPANQPKYESYPYIAEVYDDHVCVHYNDKMYDVGYTKDENGDIKFADKSKWVEMEMMMMPTGNVGAKGIFDGYEEAVKSREFGEWITDYYAILDNPLLAVEDAVKAVWSAKFVNDLPDSSFLYIKPDCGEKDEEGKTKPRSCRMFPVKDASGSPDMPHVRNAIARAPQSNLAEDVQKKIQNKARALLEQEGSKAGTKVKKSMRDKLQKAWETIKEVMDWANPPEEDDEENDMVKFFAKGESAIGLKKVGDEWWYISYSTNAFKDREAEIFSTKSLEKYVMEAEKKEDRGYFNLWHIPGTDFAEKKWQGVAGRFLIEAGPFLKDEKGKAALKFFKENMDGHKELAPEGWGCSPEYRYLPEERKSGIYKNIWITRTSVLPKMAAANIWTQGGITMALTNEQKKAAEAIFGEDLTKELVKTAEVKTKELEEAGVAHKSAEEEPKTEEKQAPAEEVIVEKLAAKMNLDWEPVKAALEGLLENQKALQEKIANLESKLSDDTQAASQKAKQEAPKYVWRLYERASEAEKTIVPEGDDLKNKKPAEAAKKDNSGASAFFPN